MRTSFLPTAADDAAMERSNDVLWRHFLDHIRADGFTVPPNHVLDVGCHRGGLLERVTAMWGPSALYGIEPVLALRKRAQLRLASSGQCVRILDVADWDRVPQMEVDLLLCFEVLHLVPDLDVFFRHVARVLAPSGRGYLVLGCHADNPVWTRWKPQLESMGHVAYSHRPMDIMRRAAEHGLLPSVRPLRDSGWVTHDPRDPVFTFENVAQMLEHHHRQKLVFRVVRR